MVQLTACNARRKRTVKPAFRLNSRRNVYDEGSNGSNP
jgi:hypothetical protein